VVFLTGNLRFMGSTLLHATTSGLIGMMMGLAFFQNRFIKDMSTLVGLALAVLLHSTFNLFIMKGEGKSTLQIFIFLWVVTVISILVFEKLRRMSGDYIPLEEVA
jgi:RsiW-degrading membrane proteinase PrsW (M82 family)